MIDEGKEGLVASFKNCVAELRAGNTSEESQIDAWMVLSSVKFILGKMRPMKTSAQAKLRWKHSGTETLTLPKPA